MIEIKDLVKRYEDTLAVDHLSCTIQKGKIYGFLGPNGAGKTTTMNIITGCLGATEGQVLIDGHDIFEEPELAKKHLGYLPEFPPLYPDMTPLEYLNFVGELKGLGKEERQKQVESVMQKTQITSVKNRLIKQLSKGYKQRVGVAQALLGSPDVIILDEPTVGLDPKQIIEIRDLIKELGKTHTIILSSHILSEVSAICDYVMIISHGRLVASDTPENLSKKMAGSNTLRLTVRGNESAVRGALTNLAGVDKITFAEPQEMGTVQVVLDCSKDRDVRDRVFYALADAKTPILSMAYENLTLEDVFLKLTSDGDTIAANRAALDQTKEGRQ